MVMASELGAYFTNSSWKIELLHRQSPEQDGIAFKTNYTLLSSPHLVEIKLCKIFMMY